jgi:hypothetical protein
MDLGVHIANFTWPGNEAAIAATPAETARIADDAGCGTVSVKGHFFQSDGRFS